MQDAVGALSTGTSSLETCGSLPPLGWESEECKKNDQDDGVAKIGDLGLAVSLDRSRLAKDPSERPDSAAFTKFFFQLIHAPGIQGDVVTQAG